MDQMELEILETLKNDGKKPREYEELQEMIGKLESAKNVSDIRIGDAYWTLFRDGFMNLKWKDKKRILTNFYEQHGTPLWQMMDEQMQSNLTTSINRMSTQLRNIDYVVAMSKEFSWPFMISLKYTWWHILENMLQMPTIIPIIVEVLRLLEPVVAMRVNTTGPRLILVGIRRLVEEGKLENDDQEANWIRLVCAILSTKSWLPNKSRTGSLIVEPLIDANESISTVILPTLANSPLLAFRALLAILDEVPENRINWSNTDEPAQNGINAASLFCSIVDVYLNAKPDGSNIARVGWDTLNILVDVWKAERIVFSTAEIDIVVDRYESLPWPERCLIFGHVRRLSKTPVQLPISKCMFDTLRLPSDEFRRVDCDDWSSDHHRLICTMSGLFQVATVSLGMAEYILAASNVDEMIEQVRSGELNEMIMSAMPRVLMSARSLPEWRGCSDLFVIMFDILQKRMGGGGESLMVNSSYSIGLRMIAPALKLCEAVARMISINPSDAALYVRNFSVLSNDIIIERVQTLKDPLAEFVAWESLAISTCALISTAMTEAPPEAVTLLLSIVEQMKKKRLVADLSMFKTVVGCLDDGSKELIMKQLDIVDERGNKVAC